MLKTAVLSCFVLMALMALIYFNRGKDSNVYDCYYTVLGREAEIKCSTFVDEKRLSLCEPPYEEIINPSNVVYRCDKRKI